MAQRSITQTLLHSLIFFSFAEKMAACLSSQRPNQHANCFGEINSLLDNSHESKSERRNQSAKKLKQKCRNHPHIHEEGSTLFGGLVYSYFRALISALRTSSNSFVTKHFFAKFSTSFSKWESA